MLILLSDGEEAECEDSAVSIQRSCKLGREKLLTRAHGLLKRLHFPPPYDPEDF